MRLEGLSWVTLSSERQVTTSLGSNTNLNGFSLLPYQLLQGLPRTTLFPAPVKFMAHLYSFAVTTVL